MLGFVKSGRCDEFWYMRLRAPVLLRIRVGVDGFLGAPCAQIFCIFKVFSLLRHKLLRICLIS